MPGNSKARNTKNRSRSNRTRSRNQRRVKRSNSLNRKNIANKNNRSNNNSSNKKTMKGNQKRPLRRSHKKGKKMNNNLKGGGSRPHFLRMGLYDQKSDHSSNLPLTYSGNDNLDNTNIYSVSH